ncbi:MAG: TPM domain-containing protein [Burkholderiales bacterium]|nr:TPM domain-containing protein [Burkholderiales bacterium]
MDHRRFWRHVAMTPWKARQAFPAAAREAIARAIAAQEKRHRGELRFVVEAELGTLALLADRSPRARAVELFPRLGVHRTAERTGVLIYVLLADQRVEIVADQGIAARVAQAEWQAACALMQEAFRAGRFEEGAVAGVNAVSQLIERHFPAAAGNSNELPDEPVML